MPVASKINILGTDVYLKDEWIRNRIKGLNLTSLAVIGDSNAAGAGWQASTGEAKSEANDGYCAVLRELYPSARIDNYAVNGATIKKSTNYIGTQVTSVINSRVSYQYIIIQAGFNDIAGMRADNSFSIGYSDITRVDNLAYTDETKMITALGSYIKKLKDKFPSAKIMFISRESQYKDAWAQFAYWNFYNELSKFCECVGITLLNLAYDNISSNITGQRNLYYYDDVHWNEKAYREIITPAILSAWIENGKGSPVTYPSCMYMGANDPLGFVSASITSIPPVIASLFTSTKTKYIHTNGIALDQNAHACSFEFDKIGTYCRLKFTQLSTGLSVTYCNGSGAEPVKYEYQRKDAFSLAERSSGAFLVPTDKENFTAGDIGIAHLMLDSNNQYIKSYIGVNGNNLHKILNPAGGVVGTKWNGGVLHDIDLQNNNKLLNGLYFVATSDAPTITNAPSTTQGYGLIICRDAQSPKGFMLAFNTNNVWVSSLAATWINIFKRS